MTDLRDGRNIGAGALLTGKLGSFWIYGNGAASVNSVGEHYRRLGVAMMMRSGGC
jgi:hypothetical protein